MTTVREIMTKDVQCVKETAMVSDAARMMRDLDVGVLPICGADDKLMGMITDRDVVVRCVAEGMDPAAMPVSELAEGRPFMVDVDDPIAAALDTMAEHQIRRVVVLEDRRLVGIISQGDIARHLGAQDAGELVTAVSA